MKGFYTKFCPQKVTLLKNMVGELLENTKEGRKIDQADPDTQKAIQLSKDVIGDFSENPSAWECRYQILVIFDVYWHEELEFITLLAKKDPCNPCLWRYRRRVIEKLGENAASLELNFTEEILTLDARNQYAWVHRKWVLQSFEGWKDELTFCRELIENDNYNCFAWKQRETRPVSGDAAFDTRPVSGDTASV
ncbi:CAAX geranylgeranyltransferase alpha subunit [Orobanche gracilis]